MSRLVHDSDHMDSLCSLSLSASFSLSLYTLHLLPISPDTSSYFKVKIEAIRLARPRFPAAAAATYAFAYSWLLPLFTIHHFRAEDFHLCRAGSLARAVVVNFVCQFVLIKGNPNNQ